MVNKFRIGCLGVAVMLFCTVILGATAPAFADVTPRINMTPKNITLTEGQSQVISVQLSEPIIAEVFEDGYVNVVNTSSNPQRLSTSANVFYSYTEWSTTKTFSISADDDDQANGNTTATINFVADSNSEYYSNFSGSITVNIVDDDTPPTVTYPAAGQVLAPGSLMTTGTGLAGQQIAVYVDDVQKGTTLVGEDGTWSYMVTNVPAGSHSVVAKSQKSKRYAYMANRHTGAIDVVNVDDRSYKYEIPNANSIGTVFNSFNHTVYSASDRDGTCGVALYDPITYVEEDFITNNTACNSEGLALSNDGKTGYFIFDSGGNKLVKKIDLVTHSVTQFGLSHLNGNYPSGVAVSPDGSQLWVHSYLGTIERFDANTLSYLGTIDLNENLGDYRQNIVFNKAGTRAYVGSSSEGAVYVIDVTDNTLLTTITVDDNVNMLALSPDESRLFVGASYPSSAIYMINTANNTLMQTHAVNPNLPPESLGMTDDGQWVVGDDHGSGAIFFGSVAGGPTVQSTIFAPNGGSYYTAVNNFTSPLLTSVLGTSTTVSFSAVQLQAPNTGL